MSNKYTASYFLNTLSKIPASRWQTGSTGNAHRGDVVGLLGNSNKSGKLSELVASKLGENLVDINDGNTANFRQKTPRARILAAIRKVAKSTAKYNPRKAG